MISRIISLLRNIQCIFVVIEYFGIMYIIIHGLQSDNLKMNNIIL